MICDKCFHFRPLKYLDPYMHYLRVAACEHPDCFVKEKRQNDDGEIYYGEKRVQNIVDLVDDNNHCDNFQPFEMVKEKTFLWFTKNVKTPLDM